MSRYIHGAPHLEKEHELYRKNADCGKILICRNGGILYAFLVRNNRIYKVAREEKDEFPIGTIILGKVLNVAKQFHGAFLALEEKKGTKQQTGFLQMRENGRYEPVNRKADGRLLCGDEIPVQIIKQAKGNKPPQLTEAYSLVGQFAVVKKRDGQIDTIPRTNAAFVEETVWQKETFDLLSQYKKIDQNSQTRAVYAKLYEPDAFYLDFIKDQRISEVEEIVTDEKDVYETLKNHAYTDFMPVRLYEDQTLSLASVYALDTRLRELINPKVHMRSGAYLVIEPTEAFIAIDVNSGKAEKKTDPETFYFQTNLEAVKEVCYQLSVRNLSGMILVDFINMKDKSHTEALIGALKEETGKDKTPTRFVDLTKLGIAEITRKKTSHTLQYTLREWAWKG